MKIRDVKVTSQTTMLDSISLRKKLRDYDFGIEASFAPGVGAFPQTRPGFIPTTEGKRAIHPDFKKNCELVVSLYYEKPVPISTASYSIKKDAKIGLPYNARDEKTHIEFMDELLNKKMDLRWLGHYIYGNRIQTDSYKIRDTGFVQLKAIGDGFQVQRHRMINAGPALNHVLGIFEFDYHHRWLEKYAATFNVVVDKFIDSGYAYALDYKHYEHSLGWDILFSAAHDYLLKTGRAEHAMLYYLSNMENKVHFRPAFSNEEAFYDYISIGKDVNKYANYVRLLYGEFFGVDDHVRETMLAIRDGEKRMRELFVKEHECPRSVLSGHKIWTNTTVFNSSGVVTTAVSGKLYSIADTMCRLTEAYGIKWDKEKLDKFLRHELPIRVYNLGDDNLIFFDRNLSFKKFLDVVTGVVVTEELPVGFLSRILDNEVAPHQYKNAHLVPKSASFFRKLSRERDIFKYKYPSIGFSDSLAYAERYKPFREKENEIARLYAQEYMSFFEILDDLQKNVDQEISAEDMKYISYIDDRGKIYRDNIDDPSELMPAYYYALGPKERMQVKKLYGGIHE